MDRSESFKAIELFGNFPDQRPIVDLFRQHEELAKYVSSLPFKILIYHKLCILVHPEMNVREYLELFMGCFKSVVMAFEVAEWYAERDAQFSFVRKEAISIILMTLLL